MARNTYFVKSCPTCGRNLQVRVEYMGRRVVCQHCGAKFEASNSDSCVLDPGQSTLDLLARADELIRQSEASGIGVSRGVPVHEIVGGSLVS